jgi:sugar lactone lactonase YvrE
VNIATLLSGRGLVESPRWHDGRLYFSDWSAGEVLAAGLDGSSEVIARVDSLPLCTAWLPDGRLVIVSSRRGQLLRRESDGSLVTYADLGRPGWNDIVIDGRGNAYVNRAGFDPTAGEAVKPGSVSLVTPDGRVREVGDDFAFPNGMAVTPDNATLIVADSYRSCLVAFDIAAVRARGRGRCRAPGRRPRPRLLRLRARRSRRDDPVHHCRRMAGHDRIRDGEARQRPGSRYRGRRARSGLAVAARR